MGVRSGGQYGVAEGLICSFPIRCSGGGYEIVEGLEVGEFAQSKIDATVKELTDERDAVKGLNLIG
jgi:malate dehydrogenase